MDRVLVFTRTKHGADKVVKNLVRAGVEAAAIHGNKSQANRERALASFKSGGTRVLVATDIAARGIHVDYVSHVINYDLPNIPESYVHRIGRTARAGAAGIAISFCNGEERAFPARHREADAHQGAGRARCRRACPLAWRRPPTRSRPGASSGAAIRVRSSATQAQRNGGQGATAASRQAATAPAATARPRPSQRRQPAAIRQPRSDRPQANRPRPTVQVRSPQRLRREVGASRTSSASRTAAKTRPATRLAGGPSARRRFDPALQRRARHRPDTLAATTALKPCPGTALHAASLRRLSNWTWPEQPLGRLPVNC
jgi:ATP-dependent RNA helicase RhlE